MSTDVWQMAEQHTHTGRTVHFPPQPFDMQTQLKWKTGKQENGVKYSKGIT